MRKWMILLACLLVLAGCRAADAGLPAPSAGESGGEATVPAASAAAETLDDDFWKIRHMLPHSEQVGALTQYRNFARGPYELRGGTPYTLTISWNEGGTLPVSWTDHDGARWDYEVASGVPVSVTVPADGLYYLSAPLSGDPVTGCAYAFTAADTVQPAQSAAEAAAPASVPAAPSVVYERAELMHYTGEGAHPYVHRAVTNHTDRTIVGNQYGMLAFDSAGNPLQIRWNSLSTDSEPSYHFLCHWGSEEIPPGVTEDTPGGWSLNFYGDDPAVDQIAYVLYCDKEITFSDGVIWTNPAYEDWRAAYEGKTVPVEELAGYYPYVQPVALA